MIILELKKIIFDEVTTSKNGESNFNLQIKLFERLLEYYLSGLKTKETVTLHIYCDASKSEVEIEQKGNDNILYMHIPYNTQAFQEMTSVEEKYEEFLNILNVYVKPVCEAEKWNYEIVLKAAKKIKEHEFKINTILKGTPKKSPDKQRIAIVNVIHTINAIKMIASIYVTNGLRIKEETIIESVPDLEAFEVYMGKPVWIDDNTFQIQSKAGEWIGTVTI